MIVKCENCGKRRKNRPGKFYSLYTWLGEVRVSVDNVICAKCADAAIDGAVAGLLKNSKKS